MKKTGPDDSRSPGRLAPRSAPMKKLTRVCKICLFAFSANLLLFGVKLYVGLAANSITVFSDAVNNLFDALSGGVSFAGLFAISRMADPSAAATLKKGEQLFSCVISVILSFTAALFAYQSLERLLYPTPVWYTPLHLWALLGTALCKALMFFVFRSAARKEASPVARLMAADSLLDLCITLIGALTLWLSARETFRVDAVCGLVISVLIAVPAVKNVIAAAAGLVGYVPAKKRAAVNGILADAVGRGEIAAMRYLVDDAETTLLLTVLPAAALSDRAAEIERETGVRVRIITEENIQNQA